MSKSDLSRSKKTDASPATKEVKPGRWRTSERTDKELLVKGKKDRRYRICNDGDAQVIIIVDDKVQSDALQKNECRDVEGKVIEVRQNGDGKAKGTFDNLD